jgi:hypothetical protein
VMIAAPKNHEEASRNGTPNGWPREIPCRVSDGTEVRVGCGESVTLGLYGCRPSLALSVAASTLQACRHQSHRSAPLGPATS